MTDRREPLVETTDAALLGGVVYANSSKEVAPWTRSTGFRTNGLRYRTLSDSAEPRIAEDFLLNTRLVRHDRETEASIEAYFADHSVLMLSMLGSDSEASVRPLPRGIALDMALGTAIGRRRSARTYTGDPMAIDRLAAILRGAAGVTGYAEGSLRSGGDFKLRLRAVPSGGGLYPVEVYVAALKIQSLERGLYRYDPVRDGLVAAGDGRSVTQLLGCFAVPDELISFSRASAIFVLVGRPWRSMRKYGARGMRFLFMEAGAIAEHINLAAVALGLGSLDCASVYDDEAHEALGLDGVFECLLHTIVVGTP